MEDKYEPVSCDYHDQLEAASVRRQQVELEYLEQGVRQRHRGTIADVYTRDGAEFVKLEAGNGPVEVRLDHLVGMTELSD